MTGPTMADMAREIERRRPGTLPCQPSLLADLPNAIVEAVLRDSMMMELEARRFNAWGLDSDGWLSHYRAGNTYVQRFEADADHGCDPTRSLFAVFCAATEGGA